MDHGNSFLLPKMERLWNKNMIDRILQDQRYSGDAIYPEIISAKLYESVQRQRAERHGFVE